MKIYSCLYILGIGALAISGSPWHQKVPVPTEMK